MAIEITKPGRFPLDTTPYVGSCYNCGTEIRCNRTDGRFQYEGGYLRVKCPTCHRDMTAFAQKTGVQFLQD